MLTDVKKMLNELNISFIEHGKNWQPGWINIKCPMCSDHGHHGGFNLTKAYYNCWRCGYHRLHDVIGKLLGLGIYETIRIIKGYGTYHTPTAPKNYQKGQAHTTHLPEFTTDLAQQHEKYLEQRNFSPKTLAKTWNLKGTQHLGDYKFRIIAPVFLNKKLVSYQGRDITDQATLRYKACKIKDEVVHHKHTLYGLDLTTKRRCVIVEGIADAWRLGPGCIATFGSTFTLEQSLVISQRFDYAAILFDNEQDAQEKSRKLFLELSSFGTDAEEFALDPKYNDPAELPDSEARYFMNHVL